MRRIHKSGKFTIDLYGIEDDSQKLKGYEGEGKQLCGCWFEEFGNISDPDKITEVEETIARSMSDHAVWLYSGNPPKEANAWSRAWVSKISNLKEFRVFDTTFADIWHLLSNQNKDKIRLAYLMDRDKWEFVYLGRPSSNDGIVYNNFSVEKNCIGVNDKLDGMVIAWSIGVDVAVDRDKTVGVLSLKLDNGRIITRAIVEHDPRNKGATKLTIHEQADLIEKWYKCGKTLNCMKSTYEQIFKNEIITDLLRVIGCGVEITGKKVKGDVATFDLSALRWSKIIICTDADEDGFQIRTLLLTLFYRLLPTLIQEGKIYIAETPLFEITTKDQTYFAYDEFEKAEILQKLGNQKYTLQRSKGLGENEPEMMSRTTMHPATRRLVAVTPTDAAKTEEIFDTLLGNNLPARKEFIALHGSEYMKDADI